MGAALSRGKRRFSKRLKNAQEKPAALPVSSPKRDPLPALAESAPALAGYNETISGPESVFPQVEPLPQTLQRPPPLHSTPADARQKSLNLSNKTFRLRGIDQGWDHNRVKREVKVSFDLSDAAHIHIRSISPDPSDSKRKIATFELSEIPNGISHANRPSEWMPHAAEEELVLDTNFFGLTPLHETDDAKCTLNVIAVPGLNGHAFGSFKAKSRGRTYMWLRDSLAKDLPNARIFIYGYDTQLQGSHSFENIGDLALKLQYAINVVLNNEGMNTVRSTVLIGHSLGGIIIKEALKKMFITQSTDRANVESIRGLLFFGVPNQGMAIESLIPMVINQPNRQLLETLNENSDVLRHVTDEFITLFKSSHVKVISFYETEESPTATQIDGIWSMSGPPAILVNRHSATQGWQNEEDIIVPVKATHSGMVKLENKFDEPYGTVLKHLRNVMEKAKICIRELSHSENECLKSLSFPTQDSRQENVHTAHGTCDWLLRHPAYSKWFSSHRQLLWINGKPGAGKSTLMKYLSNTLKKDECSDDYILASFFIYGQGKRMQRSKLGILRSLLHQILPQLPEHLSILTKKFVEREKTRKDWVWCQEELMEVLRSIATQGYHASRPVIILVDALDELGENLAREVVDFLVTLIGQPLNEQTSTTSTSETYVGMRICFSSRHYPDVTPPNCLSISVEMNNSADIAKFIYEKLSVSRLSSSKAPEDSELEALGGLIIKKADGVFQWVMLVIEQILKPLAASKKASALRMTVEQLPSELAHLYSRILKNSSLETFQLLQWICFSREPLGLFELRQALALSATQTCASLEEYEKKFDYQLNTEKVYEMVKHLSRGLVEVKSNLLYTRKNKVGFIHQSVHDYLLKDGLLQIARGCGIPSFLNPAKQDFAYLEAFSNAQIAAACIKFLQSKEARENFKSIRFHDPYDHSAGLILGTYAVEHWLSHMTRSLNDDSIPEFLLGLFLRSVRILLPCPYIKDEPVLRSRGTETCGCERWKELDYSQRYRHEGFKTMLHWLVAARSYPILEVLTNSGQSLDTPDERGRTPLMEAILAVDIKATTLLLDSGLVDVNWKDEQNQTPLHHAATDLHSLDIFASLLKKITIACDEMDQGGYTPLLRSLKSMDFHYQSCSQHLAPGTNLIQAARWLLNGGKVNPNQTYPEGDSVLAHAARKGYSPIVELLINIPDVEINSRNKDGKTPIFHAMEARSRETFILLLENEHTSLDLEDHSGRNTLSYAAEFMEPQDVAKLIQKPNIGLDKQDNSGRTPLSYSIRRLGDVAQIFLDTNNVDPFLKDNKGRSPVSYAAKYGRTNAFERLWMFENKSNRWNEPDSRDRTPLSYAAQYNPTAVRLLLSSPQVARNQADCDGRTPLSYAAQYNPAAVRLLLDDPRIARNQADCNGHTPFWHAVVNYQLKSLRYLLSDHKVEKGSIGFPILHKAIESSNVLVADLLIKAGWDVNMKDQEHRNALSYVCDIETANVLLNTKSIDFEMKDRRGRTALFHIAKNGCPEVIRLLIEDYGCDDLAQDEMGCFARNYAQDRETRMLLSRPFTRDGFRELRERQGAKSIPAANPEER